MTEVSPTNCPHCQAPLPPSSLVCPNCHRLVFENRVGTMLEEVNRVEVANPAYASSLLRQAMAYIPPGSQPHQMLLARANALMSVAFGGAANRSVQPSRIQPAQSGGIMSSPLTTLVSMALSIWVYQRDAAEQLGRIMPEQAQRAGWIFAAGFVLLIFIHEMGHVVANWYYGLKQSAPLFIPYMGAVIFLKSNPPDAKAEAVVGIAGPVAGTLGALACLAATFWVTSPLYFTELRLLAHVAFMMNLFNMIPCPPLDGGRVAAAISPLLWVPGIIGFIAFMFFIGGQRIDFVVILMALWILQSAWPRVRRTIMQGGLKDPYYRATVAQRLMVSASYFLLAGLLALMFWGPRRLGLHLF